MIFKLKEKEYIPIGTKRVVEKFAWLPVKIDDELVWLEKIRLHQRRTNYGSFSGYWEVDKTEVIDERK